MPIQTTVAAGNRKREWLLGEPGETNTLTIVDRVWWTPGEGEDETDYPGDLALILEVATPRDRRESAVADDWIKNLICRRVKAVSLPSPDLFTLEVTSFWTTLVPPSSWGDFARVTYVPGARSMPLYRIAWDWEDVPTDGSVVWPPDEDMGGTRVDIHGQPRMIGVPQLTVTVEVLWNRTRNTPVDPPESWMDTYVNTRNEAEFLGFPIGSLLYKGFSNSPASSETGVVAHTFVYDSFQHLQQRPVTNPSGEVGLTIGVTLVDKPQRQVNQVVWEQPYPDLTDFEELFTEAQLAELATPKPEWPT